MSRQSQTPRDVQWIAGPQGKLRVDDGGTSGLPVVFVHGNGGNRTQWAAQLAHLRKSRRAVAFDLRGMGESAPAVNGDYSVPAMVEDLAPLVDTLGLTRFVLVGHSFGGAVIGAYAGKHPDRVAGLVFADSVGDFRTMPLDEIERLHVGFRSENYEKFTEQWFKSILVNAEERVKAVVMASLRATPSEVFIGAIEGLLAYDPRPALERYRGPRMSIAAEMHDEGLQTL